MSDDTLLKIEIRKSEYSNPNAEDGGALLYTLLVTGSSGETNVYLMEESFWNKLEPKLRRLIKKMFDSTQSDIVKKELLK